MLPLIFSTATLTFILHNVVLYKYLVGGLWVDK